MPALTGVLDQPVTLVVTRADGRAGIQYLGIMPGGYRAVTATRRSP